MLKKNKTIKPIRIFNGPGPTILKKAIKNKTEVIFRTHGLESERKVLVKSLRPKDKPYVFELIAPSGKVLGEYNTNTRTGYLFLRNKRPIKI